MIHIMLTSVIFPTEQYSELIYFEEREERLKSFSKNFKMKKKIKHLIY